MSAAQSFSGAPPWAHRLRARLVRAFPAPFGWHTRHMLRSYILHTFLTASGILVIALSIDLTFFLAKVLAAPPAVTGIEAALRLGGYALLRSADFLAELLPLACFLGVLWSEISHTMSKERLIVWLSGRTPAQCLAPILLFALFAGATEWLFNIYIRPAAVANQVAAGLGAYGERFNRGLTNRQRWIAAGADLVRASIDFRSPPVLHDVRVYRTDARHRLTEVIMAEQATVAPDGKTWIFRNVTGAEINANRPGANAAPQASVEPPATEFRLPEKSVDLKLDPLWLSNYGINVRYLPNTTFNALRNVEFSPDSEYRTWTQARHSLSLFAGAMALLAGCLSLSLLAYRVRLEILFFAALAGYGAHVMMKLFIVLGEQGYISPVIAAWAAPLLLAAAGPILVWRARSAKAARN